MAAVGVTGLLIVGVTGTLVWLASYSSSIEFEEPSVQAPLAKASVTKAKGKTSEVFATLAAGTKLEDVASLRLFDGFEAAMTKEEAERRLGPPSGGWTDPIYGVRATYYDRPDGRVSLVRRGEEWQTVGHPSKCRTDEVFRDPRMLQQFQQWLPGDEHVQVNVLRSAGWGGLSVWTNDKACTHLVLTARDSDPTELPD